MLSDAPPALLLSAGLGTRLRPLTLVRAKPALPVAGVPMVRRIMMWLAAAGVHDVVVNLHYLPESIARVVGEGDDTGVHARYSWEQPRVLGSAGGVRQALDILGADTFLIVNGDTLTDLDLAPLIAGHRASGARVTMAVVPNAEPHRYSGLRVADDGAITGVVARGSSLPSWHFIGVQVAHASVFAEIPTGTPANSVNGVYDALMAASGQIRAHRCTARFWDIGTVTDYWSTSHLFATEERRGSLGTPVTCGEGARIVDSIIWDNVIVGARAHLAQCIVTDGVQVPPEAAYSRRVLLAGPGASIVALPFEGEMP